MRVIAASDIERLGTLLNAGWNPPAHVVTGVREVLDDVRARGDVAVVEYAKRFDDASFDLSKVRVPLPMRDAARALVVPEVAQALERAGERIERFHERQRQADLAYAEEDGTRYGVYRRPLESVAAYVAGAASPAAASLLMCVVPAKIAGVSRIIVLTPTRRNGHVHPAIVYACSVCEVDELYAVGGAHAIAAAAFGTESIAPVEKIVGTGGIWVSEAKRQVFGYCGVDMLAGPSEVLVVADDGANSEYVAGELLSQAEQQGASRLGVVSESRPLLEATAQLLDTLGSSHLEGYLIHAASREEVFETIERVAPGCLCLQVRDAPSYLPRIRRAGAIFVGDLTPLACGYYLGGINHVVPTSGTARWASGLRLEDFTRTFTVVENSMERLMNDAPFVSTLAELEGLPAHAQSARMRYGA